MRLEKIKNIGKFFRNLFDDKTELLITRRQQIDSMPINPNGSTFPDTWSASVYKERLTREGYRPIEGTVDGLPFIRPVSEAEDIAVSRMFKGEITSQETAAVLDNYSNLAKEGKLTDVPLYRDPRKINQDNNG